MSAAGTRVPAGARGRVGPARSAEPARRTQPDTPTRSVVPPIGGHAAVAGGPARAVPGYLAGTGAAAVQIYVGNPRGWARPDGDPAQDAALREACPRLPLFIHANLLVNLGSPTPATVEHSAAALAHALRRAGEIGAQAVVYHAGSSVDPGYTDTALRQVREALLPLLDGLPEGGPELLVEPSAGGGYGLASRMEQLDRYLSAVDRHPRLGICFDTCHAFAAGHPLDQPGGMTATLDTVLAAAGPGRLRLVHANDSKDPCGSTRDRHENIGAGRIGVAAFAELFGHPATAGVPVIVETPSQRPAAGTTAASGRIAPDALAGHAADIALLRSLAGG